MRLHSHAAQPTIKKERAQSRVPSRTGAKVAEVHVPNSESISSSFNSLPCSLTIHRDAEERFVADVWSILRKYYLQTRLNPQILQFTQVIRLKLYHPHTDTTHSLLISSRLFLVIKKARKLGINMKQCFAFYMLMCLTLSASMLLSYILLLPPILNGIHIIWLVCIQLPIIAASFMFSHSEPGVCMLLSRMRSWYSWTTQYSRPRCLIDAQYYHIIFRTTSDFSI